MTRAILLGLGLLASVAVRPGTAAELRLHCPPAASVPGASRFEEMAVGVNLRQSTVACRYDNGLRPLTDDDAKLRCDAEPTTSSSDAPPLYVIHHCVPKTGAEGDCTAVCQPSPERP